MSKSSKRNDRALDRRFSDGDNRGYHDDLIQHRKEKRINAALKTKDFRGLLEDPDEYEDDDADLQF